MKQIIIVGAGASGLVAAIKALQAEQLSQYWNRMTVLAGKSVLQETDAAI